MANTTQLCFAGNCTEVQNIDAYTKQEVNDIVSAIETAEFFIVQSLPATGENKKIYLVPNSGSGQNVYDEYLYISGAWEVIGSTQIDLSQYYTKTQTDALLANKQNPITAGAGIAIANDEVSVDTTGFLKMCSGNSGDITVPAGDRVNTQIDITGIPTGFTFGAYRQISIQAGTGDANGFKQCAIQFFGSAGGGTKANIGIKSFAATDVVVKVAVMVLFFKA